MNRYPTILVAIATALLLTAGVAAQRGGGAPAELEAVTQRAAVTGDLNEAISAYGRIADRYAKSDPAVAAMALVRMAQAYESQGNREARRVYERVVQDSSSQKDAAASARAALTATAAPLSAVTSEIDVQGLYTVSPDGRYAFTVDNEIYELQKGTSRPFGTGDGNSDSVSVSKDGKYVAYVWEKFDARGELSAELRVASTAPGIAQDRTLFLTDSDSSIDWLWVHDWTPDDKWIAVVLRRKDSCEIGLISVDDGRYRSLKSVDSRRSVPGGVFVNPLDGRYMAFDVADDSTGRQRDIFVLTIDRNSVEAVRIVDNPTDDAVVGWSPDGKYLVFASRRTSGVTDLRAVPFRGGKPAGTPMVIRPNMGPFESFGITRSGALFYAVSRPPSRFQLANVGVSAERLELSSLSRAVEIDGGSPRFSPDSKHVVYVTQETAFERRPRLYTLWIRSLDSPVHAAPNRDGPGDVFKCQRVVPG